ncbi:GntR family transcriptional regulator [Poriferisphaera sp. WC338]|uniref:GntR family transcriptional regulator n=1 Tax=Poriferisphaera sp. WC338 TaxID=3425129 RepID=UPI003D818417
MNAATSTLKTDAYNMIRQMLIDGELPLGSLISEISLAKQIGIGRTPVREAISQLQHEGVVERVPRLGTIVRKPDMSEIIELYDVREALECYAVGRVTGKLPAEHLAQLKLLNEQINKIAEDMKTNNVEWLEGEMLKRALALDLGFHMIILRGVGNRRLMKMVGDSRVLMRIFRCSRQTHSYDVISRVYEHHERIRKAIVAGEPAKAVELMAEHIQTSKRETIERFNRTQGVESILQSVEIDLDEDLLSDLSSA